MQKKKTVLITGASRGIGAATAELFAEHGYNVVINYKNSEKRAVELAERIGAIAVRADVSDREQVREMIKTIHVYYGKIDVLINNAGIAKQNMFTDISDYEWDNIFDVNMKGTYIVTQEVVGDMIHNHRGHIINMSSMWGITGGSCEVAYSASKAAVIGFTKALAKELGMSNIAVNCIAPGVIDTEMNSNLDDEAMEELKEETPLGRIGTGKDIAETALFLAENKFITGQVVSPNGGIVI